jgi:CRP/FNR family cyclic AMP-dependent transcriptional regulator
MMVSPEILRCYPYFGGVDMEALRAIAVISEEHTVEAGETVFQEGEPAERLYIVTRGEVDICYQLNTGEKRVVDTVVSGELLSWSTLVPPHRTTATAVTRGPARLLAIDGERLRELCAENDVLRAQLMTQITHTLSSRLEGARVQLAAAQRA